jgi:hypothetical protein
MTALGATETGIATLMGASGVAGGSVGGLGQPDSATATAKRTTNFMSDSWCLSAGFADGAVL